MIGPGNAETLLRQVGVTKQIDCLAISALDPRTLEPLLQRISIGLRPEYLSENRLAVGE
jgi:hypothetical protein